MTNCIICHQVLKTTTILGGGTAEINVSIHAPKNFVCVCFDCIKKQNKN
jgi:hypothetical protein